MAIVFAGVEGGGSLWRWFGTMKTAEAVETLLALFGLHRDFFARALEIGATSVEELQVVTSAHEGGVPEDACLRAALQLLPRSTPVRVEGLVGSPELNGCSGRVLGPHTNERVPVRLDVGDGSTESVRVRPRNLQLALNLLMLPTELLTVCLTGLDGRALARLETTSKRVQQLADDGCWRAAVDAAGVHDARADATQVECKAMLHEVENWSRGRFLFDVAQNIVGVRASRMPSLAAPTSSSATGDPNPTPTRIRETVSRTITSCPVLCWRRAQRESSWRLMRATSDSTVQTMTRPRRAPSYGRQSPSSVSRQSPSSDLIASSAFVHT